MYITVSKLDYYAKQQKQKLLNIKTNLPAGG